MKKFILLVCVAIWSVCFTACAPEKDLRPLGFKEAELLGTVKEIIVVNEDRNLQFWTVKVDDREFPYSIFTDEKGSVGDRVVIYIAVRVPNGQSWTKVRPFNQ